MRGSIYAGNARSAGADFNGWFVGCLEQWCAENGTAFEPDAMGLRNTTQVEVKWGVHPAGQSRPGGWAGPTGKIALSLLVSGIFVLKFRVPQAAGREITYRLSQAGDYVIWREALEHTWQAETEAIILTVRWTAA